MTDNELVARTLCRAAATNGVRECPYCVDGACQPTMWKTFLNEAAAVLAALSARGRLASLKAASVLHR